MKTLHSRNAVEILDFSRELISNPRGERDRHVPMPILRQMSPGKVFVAHRMLYSYFQRTRCLTLFFKLMSLWPVKALKFKVMSMKQRQMLLPIMMSALF